MDSNAKIVHRQLFFEGMNTVVSPENAKNTQFTYSLNCDVVSSENGNVGVVTNVKGNIQVPVELPEGENKTIGVGLDEERNKLYFAVWNSEGYNTWYEFDSVSNTVKIILQCITDTGGVNIFKWTKESVILHVDIVQNDLLYWTVKGDEARKFSISKAIDKSEKGYGYTILEDFTRAYKKAPSFPPEAEYFTNSGMLTNSLYGYLFKFAVQFIYDDGEESTYSDYSRVAIPTEENSAGIAGVPNKNNGIKVRFMTGGRLVKKIRLAMKKTNNEGGESDWVNVLVVDKKNLNVADDSEYEYDFYNNNSYLGLDQNFVKEQQSYLPREPLVQAFAGNAMIYGNFVVGRDPVPVDLAVNVSYEDLFIPSEVENKLNAPSVVVNFIDGSYVSGWRHTLAEVVIGPDVKKGNVYIISAKAGSTVKFVYTVVANTNDTSRTIAAQFHSRIANNSRVILSGGYIRDIEEVGGSSKFRFNFRGDWHEDYLTFTYSAKPVYYNTLKNTGNSVANDKMGAAFRYAVYYEDQDGRKSLAYGNEQLVEIKSVNQLGGVKKVTTQIAINNLPPAWATKVGIVRTKNLNQLRFIQVLIQSINVTTTTTTGEKYHDLSLGSLYTYQQVHPNTRLTYTFEKGDRLRYVKKMVGNTETTPASVIDYEVIGFYPEVKEEVNENVTIDGTAEVATAVDANRVGNHIIINNAEREIIAINGAGTKYILNSAIGKTGTPETFPSYTIINKRGVVRIKMNDAYPIEIDANADTYAVVEVYKPYQSQSNSENDNYYNIGYKFDIKDGYHLGNIQDQTSTQPAIIQINGLDNYVRKREMITNLSVKNPSLVLATIEDQSFSDFYVSDLSSYGRATVLDDAIGEVYFGDRLVSSTNYIEGTSLNGLNMFSNLNRADYNDKYGDIMRIMFNEGKLFIFKYLKTCWGPIYGRVLTDNSDQSFLSASDNLLPDKLQYFLWEGGVGNNAESVVRDGNDIFGVSPNSGVIFRLGGNGVLPISKIFGIDNEARDMITSAAKSGVKMFGGYNRKKGNYVLTIPGYDKVAYDDLFYTSNYKVVPVPQTGAWEITSAPSNGLVSIGGNVATYSPNSEYSGMDYFSYRSGAGTTRQVCVNILPVAVALEWIPSGRFCETSGSTRTGKVGYATLSEYDNISESYTGVTKPNDVNDPDYVEPILDESFCPIGLGYSRLMSIGTATSPQNIAIEVQSADNFKLVIKKGASYANDTIAETATVASGIYTLEVPLLPTEATLYLEVPSTNYAGVTKLTVNGAYIRDASFYDLSGLTELVLDQSSIPPAHNLVFNNLDISGNPLLTKLIVKNHKLSLINLASHPLISYLDVSMGAELAALSIGDWSKIKTLNISECKFTSDSYSAAYIDSVLASLDTNAPSGNMLKYGKDNNSGVRPSSSAYVYYESLQGKGFTIVGRTPMAMSLASVYASATVLPANRIRVAGHLSQPLSVNVTLDIEVTYGLDSYVRLLTIPAGSTTANVTDAVDFPGVLETAEATVLAVNPNPAGGVTIEIIE